jgi:hypothetical protein
MDKSNTHAAFVITKPIQLLMALAILEQETPHKEVTIFFCDSFTDARNVERRFKRVFKGSIHSNFCNNRIQAINLVAGQGFDFLYVDSDVGVQHYIALLRLKFCNPFCLVNVFEEGYGTYYVDSYTGIKKVIFKTLGVGGNYGGNIFTSHIYLYDPDKYAKKFYQQRNKTILIKTSIWEVIEINSKVLKKTFNITNYFDGRNKRDICYIYLTGHSVDYDFINRFKIKDGQLFIKYHPHLNNLHQVDGVEIINSSAPIECILYEFLNIYERVIIYDHNSAARQYVLDPRVSFKLVN